MAAVQQNYFTCTLGQAAERRRTTGDRPFETILHLIDEQAERFPDLAALGFANFLSNDDDLGIDSFVSFKQLRNLSQHASHLLSNIIPPPKADEPPVIGLLCTSSLQFAITWLGLMRLGFSVILLAPQLRPEAIAHLCSTLNAKAILVDSRCEPTATQIGDLTSLKIPEYTRGHAAVPFASGQARQTPDVAFYFHTSGTSAGLPKPIPQTHAAVSALPSFSDSNQPATFSATPLYHGGIADCLRAWTSGAMIWFFPEGLAPVTGNSLKKAVEFSRRQYSNSASVLYFSSVPYILQMLADDSEGVELLKSMDLVGYGGAAMPLSTGDFLVGQGVNLLSRFGSAECGFLMSSHREYATDKEWRYLRPVNDSGLLSFEPREDGLSELVVKTHWPLLSKTNRSDGSFATADLFEPHPVFPGAWRYHSRADAQITLANGKKFDPAPMESAILASTDSLQDVLIFGSGHEYPGALVFPKATVPDEKDVLGIIWPHFEAMNQGSQTHARVSRAMIVVVRPRCGEIVLEKSSKGTILRRHAEEKYADAIASAYTKEQLSETVTMTDEEQASRIQSCFEDVLGRSIPPDEDLYRQGVDSLSCIQIRKMIEARCLPKGAQTLPLNLLYDQGTVNAVVRYLACARNGRVDDGDSAEAQGRMMQDMSEKYGNFGALTWTQSPKHSQVVILTGATGFLGAHVLHLLRQNLGVDKVICLLRAQNVFSAHQRVSKALSQRAIPGLDAFDANKLRESRVVCLPAELSDPDLGLSGDDRDWIQEVATVIVHSAWTVNFTLRVHSFEDQIAGTRNLIDTAARAGARLVFVSSTAAVSCSSVAPISESISLEPTDASPLGYSQSKWVAESICQEAYAQADRAQCPDQGSQWPRILVLRVGQLCANQEGIWNMSEAYPLMLSTASVAGCLPDLPSVALDWLPVEQAAQAVVEAVLPGPTSWEQDKMKSNSMHPPVHHILNPNQVPSWNTMLQWVQEAETGPKFKIVPAQHWLGRFQEASASRSHSSQALIGLWKGMLSRPSPGDGKTSEQGPVFSVTRAASVLPTMREVKPLDRQRLLKIWAWAHSKKAES